MPQVLDYSAAFPGAQAIRAAEYAGAVRYIGFPDRRKCTTASELTDFSAHGRGMALVYEDTDTTWRGGYSAGQSGGQRARNHANSVGFPAGRPIYMAIDQDVVSTGEFGLMLDFLRGAASVLGGSACTGVYGEADVIDRARDAGVARYFWQTAAWSRGRRTSAHLFQRVGTVYVGGVACDVNDVLADDWGQHNHGGDMSAADAYDGLAAALKDIGSGQAADLRTILVNLVREGAYNAFAGATKDIASGAAPDLATAWSGLITAAADPHLTVTDAQLDELATRLGQHLGDDVADALGRKLIKEGNPA